MTIIATSLRLATTLHQLQVIDNNQVQIIFSLNATSYATHFQSGNTGSVVYDNFGINHSVAGIPNFCPVVLAKFAITQTLGINLRFCAKHTVEQLLLAHFQTEESNGIRFILTFLNLFVGTERYVLHQVQRKSSFTHGRTSCQNYKVGRLETRSKFIQINKTSGKACNLTFVFCQLRQMIGSIKKHIAYSGVIGSCFVAGDFQNTFFCIIKLVFNFIATFVGFACDFSRNIDKFTQNRFFANNFSVIFYVSSSCNGICQRSNVRNPANTFQFIFFFQSINNSD